MTSSSSHGERDSGFTLLEVLVALMITGFALAALAEGARSGLFLAHGANRIDQAVTRARSHLVATAHGHLASGQQSGDDGGGYRWRVTTRTVATATPSLLAAAATPTGAPRPLSLFAITATIFWTEFGRQKQVSLATQAIGPGEVAER